MKTCPRGPRSGRAFSIYVQVNTSGEQKAGVSPEQLESVLAAVQQHRDHLTVLGLATMAPDPDLPDVTEQMIVDTFAHCQSLAQQYECTELSMGMTKDLEIAIAHGATVVRIGTDRWLEAMTLHSAGKTRAPANESTSAEQQP